MNHNRYTVTHVDANHVRRRLLIGAPSRKLAESFALQLYGDAWYLSAVKV